MLLPEGESAADGEARAAHVAETAGHASGAQPDPGRDRTARVQGRHDGDSDETHPDYSGGGRNSCRIGNATQKFPALDRYVRQRLEKWLCARKNSRIALDQLAALIRESGREYFYVPGRGGTRP